MSHSLFNCASKLCLVVSLLDALQFRSQDSHRVVVAVTHQESQVNQVVGISQLQQVIPVGLVEASHRGENEHALPVLYRVLRRRHIVQVVAGDGPALGVERGEVHVDHLDPVAGRLLVRLRVEAALDMVEQDTFAFCRDTESDPPPGWEEHPHDYRTFLAVLQEGSLSGAARRLALTQPTVARHVDALEQAIGAALFIRTQRGLSPTEMALELVPHAESLAATAATLMRTASSHAGEVRGRVRISASEVVGVEHLPPLLTRLRQRHPGLGIELVLSNEVADLLGREADIAVRNVEPQQEALVARRLPSIQLGFHAHRGYLDRRGTPASMAQLAQHDVIGFDRPTPAIRAVLARFPALDPTTFALRADSDLAQLAAIRAGFGIGICQASIARREPDLVRVLADAFSIELGLWIVMHEGLKTHARCRTVFDDDPYLLGFVVDDLRFRPLSLRSISAPTWSLSAVDEYGRPRGEAGIVEP